MNDSLYILSALISFCLTLTLIAEERRPNVIESSLLKRDKSISVETYYANDSSDNQILKAYKNPIVLSPTKEGYLMSYIGILYSSCDGQCASAQYEAKLNKCGELLSFTKEKTNLKNYNPMSFGKHSPISQNSLKRIIAYANNPKIMEVIYSDIAGKDKQSHYILGNSVDTKDSNTLSLALEGKNPYNKLGRTRWGLNPWGTNTLATLFIHLDLGRRALERFNPQYFSPRGKCQRWPKFEGKTPDKKKIYKEHSVSEFEKLSLENKRQITLIKRRIENFKIEEKIMNELRAKKMNDLVLPYEKPLKAYASRLDSILDLTALSKEEKSKIKSLPIEKKAVIVKLLTRLDSLKNMRKLIKEQTPIFKENGLEMSAKNKKIALNLFLRVDYKSAEDLYSYPIDASNKANVIAFLESDLAADILKQNLRKKYQDRLKKTPLVRKEYRERYRKDLEDQMQNENLDKKVLRLRGIKKKWRSLVRFKGY